MDFLTVQTSIGPLALVGRVHIAGPRPTLLAIRGAFPPKEHFHDLADRFGGVNVLIATLPGMTRTPWIDTTPASFAAGLDEVLRHLTPNGPIVVFGNSTGNLVALNLRSPRIVRFIADEPFFQTQDLWPFIANGRERLALPNLRSTLKPQLWSYFGIAPDRLENRDYRRLLERITVPMDVVVGGDPLLPERDMDHWPSFTSEEDRALLRANPQVNIHVGPSGSGHGFSATSTGRTLIEDLMHKALVEAAKLID